MGFWGNFQKLFRKLYLFKCWSSCGNPIGFFCFEWSTNSSNILQFFEFSLLVYFIRVVLNFRWGFFLNFLRIFIDIGNFFRGKKFINFQNFELHFVEELIINLFLWKIMNNFNLKIYFCIHHVFPWKNYWKHLQWQRYSYLMLRIFAISIMINNFEAGN